MKREEMIKELIEFNLELARNSTEWNDQFIYDALRYGLEGFEKMTDAQLETELSQSQYN